MTNHECMAITLKPNLHHPNGSVQKSQDRKKHVKFGKIWRFCSLFSSIAKAWCILNSCHKVSQGYWPSFMPQPLYSPVLASADFFLFPKLKTPMKVKRFATIEEIKVKSQQKLLAIPKSAFQKSFKDWEKTLA